MRQPKSSHYKRLIIPQIAKFMGPTWGPHGSCRPQMGPMLAPWTLLSGTGRNFRNCRKQQLFDTSVQCSYCVHSHKKALVVWGAYESAAVVLMPLLKNWVSDFCALTQTWNLGFNSHQLSDAYICRIKGSLVLMMIRRSSVPSHYLNKWWLPTIK